jgi:hypothetical protein
MWILPKQLHTLASVQDTGALNLDLNESSQLCAQSLFVRSKLSPLRTWLQKWKRNSWTQHLFGRILKPSLGKAFEIEWTSLLEAIPVSPSVQQESEPGKTTQDTFGPGLQMELLQCDQNYVSLKTSKDISRWGCPTLSKTWQEWVIERRGAYSARLNVVRFTNAKECGSWPTPNTADSLQGGTTQGNRKDPNLSIAVYGPPAPANHSTHGSRPESWATPRCSMAQDKQEDSGRHRLGEQAQHNTTGKLNPRWVETLMGLPIGWTMPSCGQPIANHVHVVTMSSAGNVEDTTQTAHAQAHIATMIDSRIDELRLLGNGVVPACAALAFTTLLNEQRNTRHLA